MHNGNDCCHIDITVLGGADEWWLQRSLLKREDTA
jgi:hypothetical protein